jgi:hypothetical protein
VGASPSALSSGRKVSETAKFDVQLAIVPTPAACPRTFGG